MSGLFYIAKPKYNGVGKRVFTDPKEAVAYLHEQTDTPAIPRYRNWLDAAIDEWKWIGKLEIVEAKNERNF
jgi:hypothetical protein